MSPQCSYYGCDDPAEIRDDSEYRRPRLLCAGHGVAWLGIERDSHDERRFIAMCDNNADAAIDQTADAVMKVL